MPFHRRSASGTAVLVAAAAAALVLLGAGRLGAAFVPEVAPRSAARQGPAAAAAAKEGPARQHGHPGAAAPKAEGIQSLLQHCLTLGVVAGLALGALGTSPAPAAADDDFSRLEMKLTLPAQPPKGATIEAAKPAPPPPPPPAPKVEPKPAPAPPA
eukprot:CAMPEP_0175580548 /NCGR_PEP_ID=MMETSP0096-20121207/47166_1 /TAXON_ID=311494 /ORGANISM="Alexandrium monilatum, Strain CCMP3105" /LENGTH=155 /DNA_ID=CAMNT_0016884169 /DNA_START=38 /DNA_END=501 /DNA_ORIENTATION=+